MAAGPQDQCQESRGSAPSTKLRCFKAWVVWTEDCKHEQRMLCPASLRVMSVGRARNKALFVLLLVLPRRECHAMQLL